MVVTIQGYNGKKEDILKFQKKNENLHTDMKQEILFLFRKGTPLAVLVEEYEVSEQIIKQWIEEDGEKKPSGEQNTPRKKPFGRPSARSNEADLDRLLASIM